MAAIALVTANRVRVVESLEQLTLPTDEAIGAGVPVRIATATGKFTAANATVAAEARIYGVTTQAVSSGMPVTAIRRGVLDGSDFTAQAYDAAIYLSSTDGTLDDAAGTVSTVVGRVIPATSNLLGAAYDKLLLVSL